VAIPAPARVSRFRSRQEQDASSKRSIASPVLLNSHPENLALAYTESMATMRYIFVPQYGGTDIVKMPHGAPEAP
jgi:hypothetical protein